MIDTSDMSGVGRSEILIGRAITRKQELSPAMVVGDRYGRVGMGAVER
ncbi:hypothetical protein [Streptomyces sp. NPDC088360]